MKVTKWMRKKAMQRLIKVENLNISKREKRIKRTAMWMIVALLSWVIPFTTDMTERMVFENVYAATGEQNPIVTGSDSVNPGVDEADGSRVEAGRDGESLEAKISKIFPEAPEIMIAIARAESGMDPNATNVNTNGSSDIGLFQINSIHGHDDLEMFDPDRNIEAARKIYEKQGLTAWTVFQTGVYKKFL